MMLTSHCRRAPPSLEAPFYEGKTVAIIHGRVYARRLRRPAGPGADRRSYAASTFAGNPTLVVRVHAGWRLGAQDRESRAQRPLRPDGLTLASPGVATASSAEQSLGRLGEFCTTTVQAFLRGFAWQRTARTCSSPARIAATKQRRETCAPQPGASGMRRARPWGTASYYEGPSCSREIIGLNDPKLVARLPAAQRTSDIRPSMRGEMRAPGACTPTPSSFGSEPGRTWAEERPGPRAGPGRAERDPRLTQVPTIWELLDKYNKSPTMRGLTRVLLAPDDMGRPFFGPPRIAAERIKTPRGAFTKVLKRSGRPDRCPQERAGAGASQWR